MTWKPGDWIKTLWTSGIKELWPKKFRPISIFHLILIVILLLVILLLAPLLLVYFLFVSFKELANQIANLWRMSFGPFIITILTLGMLKLTIYLLSPSFHRSLPPDLVQLLLFFVLLFLSFALCLKRLPPEKAKRWETIAGISVAFGTILLAAVTVHHTQVTTKIVDEIRQARKYEVSPWILIRSVEYAGKGTPKLLSLFIQNTGKGDALDLRVVVERFGSLREDIEDRYALPCFFEAPGDTFSIDQLRCLSKDESKRIPIDISNVYRHEKDSILDDSFWQRQVFKVYVQYEDVDGDCYQTSREVSVVPSVQVGLKLAARIDTSKKLKHPDRCTRNRFQEIECSDSLVR